MMTKLKELWFLTNIELDAMGFMGRLACFSIGVVVMSFFGIIAAYSFIGVWILNMLIYAIIET